MICFYCGKDIDIENGQRYAIIPIERPYVNLPVHQPECMMEVNRYGWEEYIMENASRIYEFVSEQKDIRQGKKVKKLDKK